MGRQLCGGIRGGAEELLIQLSEVDMVKTKTLKNNLNDNIILTKAYIFLFVIKPILSYVDEYYTLRKPPLKIAEFTERNLSFIEGNHISST